MKSSRSAIVNNPHKIFTLVFGEILFEHEEIVKMFILFFTVHKRLIISLNLGFKPIQVGA